MIYNVYVYTFWCNDEPILVIFIAIIVVSLMMNIHVPYCDIVMFECC